MHFFKLPRLGAFIAVPMNYNSYISDNSFDTGLEIRLKFLEE